MLPVYSPDSHSHYQDFFISNFLKYYPDPFSISRQTWKVIIQFWHMDLSETPNILMDSYSKFGPLPRDPASMLRSYLLSIKLKITSVTDWVSKLKELHNDFPGLPGYRKRIRVILQEIRNKEVLIMGM